MSVQRDVALVLSGGGMNGVLMELGFLKRIHESPYWPRVGWIFGTSAGALSGSLAAVDRLDELEQFLLALPMKPLCSEGCKGLCTICGTNLNRGACDCKREWEDPRLAALKVLRKDDA